MPKKWTPPPPKGERKITPEMQRAMDKHGGALPMRVKDGETGEILHDNSDASAMAWRSIWSFDIPNRGPVVEFQCPDCGYDECRSFDLVFDTGWNCVSCGVHFEPRQFPEEARNLSMQTGRGIFDRSELELFIDEWFKKEYNNKEETNA